MRKTQMRCEQYKPLLSSFIDRSLDASQVAEVEEHIKACPECAGEVSRLKGLSALLDSTYAGLEPDADFTRTVMAMVSTAKSPAEKVAGFESRFSLAKRIAAFACISLGYIVYALVSFGRTNISASVNPAVQAFYIVNIIMAISGLFMVFCCKEAVNMDSWLIGKVMKKCIPVSIQDYSLMRACGIAFIGAMLILPFFVSF